MRGVGRTGGGRSGDGEVTICSAGSAGGRCGKEQSSASIAAPSLQVMRNRSRAHQNRAVAGVLLNRVDIALRQPVEMAVAGAMHLITANLRSMPPIIRVMTVTIAMPVVSARLRVHGMMSTTPIGV